MLKKTEVLLQLERTRRFPGGSLSLGEMGVGKGVGGQSWDPQQDTRGTATADSTCSHTPVVRERTRGTEDAHGGSSRGLWRGCQFLPRLSNFISTLSDECVKTHECLPIMGITLVLLIKMR